MFEVATATMAQLIAFYNERNPEKPVKRFADRKTAEKRVSVLLAAAPVVETVAAIEAPINETDSTQENAEMAKTKQKAAKAKVKKTKEPKAPADRSAAVKSSWSDAKVAAARSTHNKVKVGGEVYGSVRKAFAALGLPDVKHIKFRGELKRAGKLTFEHDGKKFNFTVVANEKD